MVKVLGLDVSARSTGYAIIEDRKLRARSTGLIKVKSGIPLGERLAEFHSQLSEVLKKTKPDEVVIEDTFLAGNVKTLKLLCYFAGVAVLTCGTTAGIYPEMMTVGAVRKVIGTKNKEETFDFIVKKFRLKWDFDKDNDRADAAALALSYYIKNTKEME